MHFAYVFVLCACVCAHRIPPSGSIGANSSAQVLGALQHLQRRLAKGVRVLAGLATDDEAGVQAAAAKNTHHHHKVRSALVLNAPHACLRPEYCTGICIYI